MLTLAVQRYRLANAGRLPARIDDVAPAFIDQIPADPFDDQPLRYLPRDNGYSIYSIGANNVDDGGVEFDKSHQQLDIAITVRR